MLAPLIGGDAMRQLIYSIVFFAGSVFRCTAPGKADKLARTHSVSDADRTDFRAVFRLPVSSGGRALRRADRRLRFAAGPDGHSEWLPDNGYAGGTQFRRGYRAELFRDYGIEDEQQVRRSTIRAGWIAGAMLLLVYAMLTHVGALSGAAWPGRLDWRGHAE